MTLWPTRPALGLPGGQLASGLAFALFREAKRVGGRGISDFLHGIFSWVEIFEPPKKSRDIMRPSSWHGCQTLEANM